MSVTEEMGPRLSGRETPEALIEAGERPPIGETLDFELTEVGDGWAVLSATPGLRAYNPIGSVHGGYASTLLESSCGCAVHSKLSPQQAYTTLELKVAFHKAITVEAGPMRAEGRVQTMGRRVAFAEAELRDAGGRLYATATSTLLIFEG